MAGKDNLKPVRTKGEARSKGRKGGIASGQARREKATLRAALEVLLERKGEDGKTGREALAVALYDRALKGDVRAFAELRDTVGEKPTNKLEMGGDLSIAAVIEEGRKRVARLR